MVSGKTALADLLASGAGSDQPFSNRASFISRAGRLLNGAVAQVEWTHGETTRCDLSAALPGPDLLSRGVRYLSQQFVERLCSTDGVSDDLLTEIERVVFTAWPVEQRQGATSFQELLDIRISAARARRQAELERISALSEAITQQRILKTTLPKKEADLELQKDILAKLEAQIRELTHQSKQGDASRLQVVGAALERRQEQLQVVERQITQLRALRSEVQTARTSRFPAYKAKVLEDHSASGLAPAQWESFATDFVGPVDDVIKETLQKAEKARAQMAGPSEGRLSDAPLDNLPAGDLALKSVVELAVEQKRLQRLIGLDAQRTAALGKVTKQAADVRGKITKLNGEILEAGQADLKVGSLTQDRLDHYASYFNALLEEEQELQALYAPLKAILDDFGPSVAKLRLSVRRTVEVAAWAAAGEAHLDLRTTGPFHGVGSLQRIADEVLVPAWHSGDGADAAEAIKEFSEKYSRDLRMQRSVASDDVEAYRTWERSLALWLYSADHISLSYTLVYDNLNIERLSPGSRGIVLLLLYLAVDQEEFDPLIIDQPEENLDPESVYSELVDLFRKASRRRQIIMVTHNPNLVVNTDVDQVIVARCGSFEEGRLPELTYRSGGLEDPAIRKEVCEVLEGGAEAFRQRRGVCA